MNKFDEKYLFRRAHKRELKDIAVFFDNEWKKNGILSNVSFLEYEFCDERDNVNIILALNKADETIQGLWAYYPFSSEAGFIDVAGGPWKVKQDSKSMPFLGNEIMIRAKEIIGYRTMLGVGDNPNTSGMYHRRFRKDFVGRLNHFYILNKNIRDFFVAVVNHEVDLKKIKGTNSNFRIKEIEGINKIDEKFWNLIDRKDIPYKSKNYIKKRFFEHPVYKYNIVGVFLQDKLETLIIMRVIKVDNHLVNRIVDCIGKKESFRYVIPYLEECMEKNQYEYTDFYNYGFPIDYMKEIGFVERKEDDTNIIPNYFEPFVQNNIEIYFSSPISDVFLCKADGDQDRPNYL